MLLKAFPFLSIVALLFPMGVFMLMSPPLLVLKHETPVDGLFIRGLFNLYYSSVIAIGAVAAVGCALVGQMTMTIAMTGLVVIVLAIRRWMLATMDRLRGEISGGNARAVPRFRRLHMAGMALNIVQLGIAAWGLTRLAA